MADGLIPGLASRVIDVDPATDRMCLTGTAAHSTITAEYVYVGGVYRLEAGSVQAPGTEPVHTADIYRLLAAALETTTMMEGTR